MTNFSWLWFLVLLSGYVYILLSLYVRSKELESHSMRKIIIRNKLTQQALKRGELT